MTDWCSFQNNIVYWYRWLYMNFHLISFLKYLLGSDSARHRSQDICPPISQIVLKTFITISLIIKNCPEEILIKLVIVLKHYLEWLLDTYKTSFSFILQTLNTSSYPRGTSMTGWWFRTENNYVACTNKWAYYW